MRKFTATDVASEGSEELVRKVAAHMTHGEDTARKYYRHIQGVAESVNAYSEMTSVSSRKRKAEEDEKEEGVPKFTPKLKQRIKWLPEEDKEVRDGFYLSTNTPSLGECATFLEKHRQEGATLFQGRTSKEVQDKCRTIRRQIEKRKDGN